MLHLKESLVMEGKGTPTTTTSLAVRTPSTFQLNGGYVSYYPRSGSRKNPRIEVRVETQCSAQLMKKAMEWLAENTGQHPRNTQRGNQYNSEKKIEMQILIPTAAALSSFPFSV